MRNILMISYFAPPYNIPSAVRIGKFAKYLPQHNWQPFILTVKGLPYYQTDPQQFKGLNYHNFFKTRSFDPLHFLNFFQDQRVKKFHRSNEGFANKIKAWFPIDEKIGWMPFCYQTGKKILKTQAIDAIFCTSGGIHSHVITSYLLAKKYHKPLILDIRDLWADHPFLTFTKINLLMNEYWEKKIFKFARKIIVVTPGQKKFLSEKYKFLQNKIELITNGFDPEDTRPETKKNYDRKELIFTFAGSFYKNLSPQILLKTLEKNIDYPLKLRFIGNFRNHFWKLIKAFPEQKNVQIEVISRQTKNSLHHYLQESDILLIFLPIGKKYDGILTTKLFDYLPYYKPLLAFCSLNSDLATFIKKGKLGFVASDKQQSNQILHQIIKMHRLGKLSKWYHNEEFISQFTRQKASEKLAAMLEKNI